MRVQQLFILITSPLPFHITTQTNLNPNISQTPQAILTIFTLKKTRRPGIRGNPARLSFIAMPDSTLAGFGGAPFSPGWRVRCQMRESPR
ncbi:hypothetical protein E2C01_091111 [Portunus trituberculatus]|uniref:Uncharacterized protein n=1 Tax=Portunus trituberculatus TaxID=210409 RepID=A0A5B7JIB3_PORTR|nr:hypothetical protein [Portunus trituberculatus]